MAPRIALLALAVASVPAAAWGNYVGTLRPPQSLLGQGNGLYAFASPAVLGLSPRLADTGGRHLKFGYRQSAYFAIEAEVVDFGRPELNPFVNPAALAPGMRSTGFGLDTVATLPFWNKFSVYGRFGAYRGDPRATFAPRSALLLTEAGMRGTRMRYGLGMQYDFTKALGIRAELERYTPPGQFLPTDTESDSFSVGVRWRF